MTNKADEKATPTTQKRPVRSKKTEENNSSTIHPELTKIEKMIKEISETSDKVELNGKKYTTVAKRTEVLRKHYGTEVQIKTKYISIDDVNVIFKASISIWEENRWKLIATGFAEEQRNSSEINKHAALENAETSAIGRALANLGISGGEFASMNEMSVKTGLVAKVDPLVLTLLKDLLKKSGMNEKAVIASLGANSLDMLKEEDAYKVIKMALTAIEKNKKPSTQSNKDNNNNKEDDIKL